MGSTRVWPASQGRVAGAISVFVFSAIFLQKLGFTAGGGSIGLDVFILLGVLLWLLGCRAAVIDPVRACLFAVLLCAVALSLLLNGLIGPGLKSPPALLLFLTLYAAMLVRIDVTRAFLLQLLDKFQLGMSVIAAIIIGQQLLQYTLGHGYWPNLETIVPSALLIPGYAYIRPYAWNSPYLTPNGVFFLEPSAASGFLALSLVAEILLFKRLKRLLLLVVGLFAGVAGSGPTILVLFSPLILRKLDRRLLTWGVCLGIPLLLLAVASGATSHLLARSSELSSDNSSAYARLVVPFRATVALAADPSHLLTGDGPGSSPKGDNQVQWPLNKLIFEYGLLTAVLFHLFLVIAVLGSPPSRTLTLIVLVPHLFFGGGFVSHTNIMMLVLFGSLFRVRPEPLSAESSRERLSSAAHGAEFRAPLPLGAKPIHM